MESGKCVKLNYDTEGLQDRCLGLKGQNNIGKILSIKQGLAKVVSNQKSSDYFLEELVVVACPRQQQQPPAAAAAAGPSHQVLVQRLTSSKTQLERLLTYVERNVKDVLGKEKADLLEAQQKASPADAKNLRRFISEIETLLSPLLGLIGGRDNNHTKETIKGHLQQALRLKNEHNSKQSASPLIKGLYESMITTLDGDKSNLIALILEKKSTSQLLKHVLRNVSFAGFAGGKRKTVHRKRTRNRSTTRVNARR